MARAIGPALAMQITPIAAATLGTIHVKGSLPAPARRRIRVVAAAATVTQPTERTRSAIETGTSRETIRCHAATATELDAARSQASTVAVNARAMELPATRVSTRASQAAVSA